MPRNDNDNKRNFAHGLLLDDAQDFQIVEAYKNLRTNLTFALSTSDSRIMVISSAEPSAGKSYTTANLAITMAQTGSRVLILDADLRKPTQHKLFDVNNLIGLSRLLSGHTMVIDEALQKGVAENVDLIPSGPIPPNPSELLGHARMKELLDKLTENYDYILIDTPPVNVVSDSILLMQYAAGVLLVVRQRQTAFNEIREAIEKYRSVDAPTLGVVVTDVKTNVRGYGNYRYRYYEYK
ncbi:MAG: CpsD/CapB family tyrosine-protein kinase [Clostridiales Family XIII bacterium]|jgi:capsular exopolysaccharide synthesis family protein|nr:CpsD/CapB family tyrosine-protein kinase [Clostridiales Family XIII bacterium]